MHKRRYLLLGLALLGGLASSTGQRVPDAGTALQATVLSDESGGAGHFLAVHGRRSVVMGYANQGLELWGYPFQILSGYHVGFRPVGATTETEGRALLRHVDYAPDSITRTYIGPNYLVRETIFVPLDQPAVAIRFEVEGATNVDVAVHFQPVMNLMWPGSVGGQYTGWNAEASGYLITEPEHGFSAVVGSSDTISHDDAVNSTVRQQTSFSFVVRPHAAQSHAATASVYVVMNEAHTTKPADAFHILAAGVEQQVNEAATHYAQLTRSALRIETPEPAVNEAIRWAEIALDQAWVCNPLLGCGLVAGYGPSRDARRPQYAWFFAGDGLVATNALIAAGEYSRAKEELNFIAKYQEPTTGMIWHELSQSAGYIDWAKYPYMYVHVDITADYLAAIARYVATSGDLAFLSERWPSILRAYRYCVSLISGSDHLPHIPPDKEGGDEQARPGDDLSLSAGVLTAISGFAEVAKLHGDPQSEGEARTEVAAMRTAIAAHYWDSAGNFWIDGHTQAGAAIPGRRMGPVRLIPQGVFSQQQSDSLFSQLASSAFRTDWGMREVSSSSPDYDPYSYGRGSVSAPATAQAAVAFWMGHHPETGLSIWRDLVSWNRLDAPGHMHEVLAGNFFHEQTESVPEQTWSSAAFLDSTVLGLLGLQVHGLENRIDFKPRLPVEWGWVTVDTVRLPQSTVNFVLTQGQGAVGLEIENQGAPTQLVFEPRLPLGARLIRAEFQGHPAAAKLDVSGEEEHASVTLTIPSGKSRCRLLIEGGIAIMEQRAPLQVGGASTRMKITDLRLRQRTLSIDADVPPGDSTPLLIRTPWKLSESNGATSQMLPNGDYAIHVTSPGGVYAGGYRHAHVALTFADR